MTEPVPSACSAGRRRPAVAGPGTGVWTARGAGHRQPRSNLARPTGHPRIRGARRGLPCAGHGQGPAAPAGYTSSRQSLPPTSKYALHRQRVVFWRSFVPVKFQGIDQRTATDLGPWRVTDSSTTSAASPASASPRAAAWVGSSAPMLALEGAEVLLRAAPGLQWRNTLFIPAGVFSGFACAAL